MSLDKTWGWDLFPREFAHLCDRCRYITFADLDEEGRRLCMRCRREDAGPDSSV